MILPSTNLADRAGNSYVTQYFCLSFVYLSLIFLFELLFSSFPYLSCFPFLDLITLLRVSNIIFAVFPFRSFDFQRVKRKQTRIHFDKILRNHRSRVKCAKYWNLVAKLLCFCQPVTRTKTQTTGGIRNKAKNNQYRGVSNNSILWPIIIIIITFHVFVSILFSKLILLTEARKLAS